LLACGSFIGFCSFDFAKGKYLILFLFSKEAIEQ